MSELNNGPGKGASSGADIIDLFRMAVDGGVEFHAQKPRDISQFELTDEVYALVAIAEAAKRVVDDFTVMVRGDGEEFAQVSAQAMVGLEAAFAKAKAVLEATS